jgi:hypothetical protein
MCGKLPHAAVGCARYVSRTYLINDFAFSVMNALAFSVMLNEVKHRREAICPAAA